MKRFIILVFTLFFFLNAYAQNLPLTKYVNPFVGTDAHGHTFPGATYPFGMVQLSPDTRLGTWDGCSGYHYSDSVIYGFSHTHLSGTGVEDYCDILLMPVTRYNLDKINNENYKSTFSHNNEKASPGYYQVLLDKYNVLAQLTAGKRVGMHTYTFKGDETPQIIIDLTHRDEVINSKIEIINNRVIKGYRQSKGWSQDQMVCFYIEFSEPVVNVLLYNNDNIVNTAITEGKSCKALFSFAKGINKTIAVKVAISSVSADNAKLNMLAEIKDWNFNALKSSTEKAWNAYLNKIQVNTAYTEDKKVFYTALYHTAIAPNLYSDTNGEYRGMDKKIHKADGYAQYTVFSLWDTYRALHPLFTIVEQERTTDFIKSFLAVYKQSNKLPVWELAGFETNCMIGYHSVSVIADAFRKGISGFDAELALKAMIESSNKKEFGIDVYAENGFIPAEKEHESVSKTLEYAYDDWCIAQMAKMLNKQDVYEVYTKRAQYYKNIFDKSTGFMRPKMKGKWIEPFNPREVNVHFTEANSWQYSFYVPQDVQTHIEMLGGDEKYVQKLDELFSTSNKTTGRTQVDITGLIGQYAHGNEPSHHAAYLYSYAGKPWKTQETAKKIMTTLYSSAPDGLCGNDDCGQMSAWYVLSALGIYPVCPGDNTYVFGSPMFDKAVIKLENGKNFYIYRDACKNNECQYIKAVSVNNEAYSKSYIKHTNIVNGGTLRFLMGSVPNYNFGKAPDARPISIIKENLITINPWYEVPNCIYKDSTILAIKGYNRNDKIYYKTDNARSTFIEYKAAIPVKSNIKIAAYAIGENNEKSFTVCSQLNKINTEYKISIKSRYNPQYNAGGDEGLLDGVRGDKNYKLGGWQGYQDTDFEAVIDMQKVKEINRISAGFLQDARSWIWMPVYMEVYVSTDGVNYAKAGHVDNQVDTKDYTWRIQDLQISNIRQKARYVKVFAKNIGAIPEWHPGAGGEGFIFIDEIMIE